MMVRILHGWNAMRWLRLGFAILFLFAAVSRNEPLAWAAAAVFGVQAIFNVGCCGLAACAAPTPRKEDVASVPEKITFEEIT